MRVDWYIGPEDVNFSTLLIAERTIAPVVNGYFDTPFWRSVTHIPGPALTIGNLVPGKGWKCVWLPGNPPGADQAFLATQDTNYAAGVFEWQIPYSYKIGNVAYPFTDVNQTVTLTINNSKATLKIIKNQVGAPAEGQANFRGATTSITQP